MRHVYYVTSGGKHLCFLFLERGLYPKLSFVYILSILSSDVLILHEKNIFLIFSFYGHAPPPCTYKFTNITSTNIKPFCRRRWIQNRMRESGGNALATNLGRWIWGDQISLPKTMNVIARWEPSIKVWPCLIPLIDRQTFFYQMCGFECFFKEEWISKLNLRLKSISDDRYRRGAWGIPSNVVVVTRY